MSTIYTDGAGNKYLGDCRWGNHDIAYPSISYIQSVATPSSNVYYSTWRDDIKSLLTSAGYTSMTWDTSTGAAPPSFIFNVTFPSGGYYSWNGSGLSPIQTNFNGVITDTQASTYHPWEMGGGNLGTDYAICANSHSLASMFWTSISSYGVYNRAGYVGYPSFTYAGILQDVNTGYGYYTSYNNKIVFLRQTMNFYQSTTVSTASLSINGSSFLHYIVGAEKSLLTSGRAAYTITCSDGQTPGAQWATDMWVFDNNATLGYPVIGRVPNMLLGIGTYTYLKPVKIQGTVFPDSGSPWYLPVGIFAGKTLLMRCYSSV